MSCALTAFEKKRDEIVRFLLDWYALNKRDLPWRGKDAYGVWISEIMLQQTQVATVIPFLQSLHGAVSHGGKPCASADESEVLGHWAGLGYYARARNLHEAAKRIVSDHRGELPDTPELIEKLPGIGRYTSGAILSIAYGLQRPILDGNVIRVLSRIFGIAGDPKSTANQQTLWSLAESLVPEISAGEFNQSMMELGALVCKPADPMCEGCPVLSVCIAGNSEDPSALPEIPAGKKPIPVTMVSAIVRNETGEFLVVQRPRHGLWGGLWEFPRIVGVPNETLEQGAIRAASETVGLPIEVTGKLSTVKHGVTHHRITLHGALGTTKASIRDFEPNAHASNYAWVLIERLEEFAFSAPQSLLREALLTRGMRGEAQVALEL